MAEASFPRGGKAVLSGLELREIKKKAERDALFESNNKTEDDVASTPGKKKNKRKLEDGADNKRSGKKREKTPRKKPLEAFSFGRLTVGTVALGSIVEIHDFHMSVALANGLLGIVKISDVSDELSEIAAAVAKKAEAADDDNGNDDSDEEEDEDVSLHRFFSINQIVNCIVLSLDSSSKRKKLQLSLNPKAVNEGIIPDNLQQGMTLAASVTSVEDHGYVMNFGIEGVTGFMKDKFAEAYLKEEGGKLEKGSVVQVAAIADRLPGARVIKVSLEPSLLKSVRLSSHHNTTFDTVKPGHLVDGVIAAHRDRGAIDVTFLGLFEGMVETNHLYDPIAPEEVAAKYPVKKKVRARVLYVIPGSKTVGLTLQPHLTKHLKVPPPSLTIGDKAKVTTIRVDPGLGVLGKVGDNQYGYIHIAKLTDTHVDKIPNAFKPGKTHDCRVLGFNGIDNVLRLSTQKSVMAQEFLRYEDVPVGHVVEGTVVSLESFGMIVSLSDTIRGLCPTLHLSDVRLKKPEKRFKAGTKVKCRVLKNLSSGSRRKLVLTAKKTMVNSTHSVISDIAKVKPGDVAHGFISAVRPYGCLVTFYNSVRGLAPLHSLSAAEKITKPEKYFQVGQVVAAKVTKVDVEENKINLSFKLSANVSTPKKTAVKLTEEQQTAIDNLSCGDIVKAKVVSLEDDVAKVTVGKTKIPSRITMEHLADHPGFWEKKFKTVKVGDVIDAMVFRKQKSSIELTNKPVIKATAKKAPTSIEDLDEGTSYPGVVTSITEFGCFVRLLHGLDGVVAKRNLAKRFVDDPNSVVVVGQTVLARATKVEEDKVQFSLGIDGTAKAVQKIPTFVESYFDAQKEIIDDTEEKQSLKVDTVVDAVVSRSLRHGISLKIGDVQAFATLDQAKGVKVTPGETVSAHILDIDPASDVVDVSLRPEMIERASKKGKRKKLQGAVEARVELVKEDYLVLSLTDGPLAYAAAKSFNDKQSPFARFKAGRKGIATIVKWSKTGRVLCDFKPQSPIDDKTRSEIQVGTVRSARIKDVQNVQLTLAIGDAKGRVHMTEILDDPKDGDEPLEQYRKGQSVNVKVLGFHDAKKHQFLAITHRNVTYSVAECSLRPSRVNAPADTPMTMMELGSLKIGEPVKGYIQAVDQDGIWLCISPTIRGRVRHILASNDVEVLQNLPEHFAVGQCITSTVAAVDTEKRKLQLSLIGKGKKIRKGSVVAATVVKTLPDGLKLWLSDGTYGHVHITNIDDKFHAKVEKKYKKGTLVIGKVTGKSKERMELNLRPSIVKGEDDIIDPVISSISEVKPDEVYRGYIKSVADNGVFVFLGPTVVARVQISNLSDLFIRDFQKSFTVGQLVTGRVLSVTESQVELSLKQSVVDPSAERPLVFSDMTKGKVVKGAVKKVESYGVFIAIANSNKLTGLAHISEVSDKYIKDLKSAYHEGDKVKAIVVKVDEEAKKISLGLKRSYFKAEDLDSSDDEDQDDDVVNDIDSDDASDDDKMDSGSEAEEAADPADMDSDAEEATAMEIDVIDSAPSKAIITEPAKKKKRKRTDGDAPTLDVGGAATFHWGNEDLDKLLTQSRHADSESESEDDQPETTSVSKRTKRSRKAAEERAVQEKEEANARGAGVPESVHDYDRLVLAQPNNSYVWIKYIAFHLQMTEIEKARAVAVRALEKMSHREEKERMNIWVARLNLENTFGSPEDLQKVFEEALQRNDAEKMYIHMTGIFERTGKNDEAKKVFEAMKKKYKQQVNTWVQYGGFLMRIGDVDAARDLLNRSLKSLDKPDHITIITKFAILEFRHGSAERARTLLERILANYPKRVDLWSVYIDQELKIGDADTIRGLFDRVITLSLSSKKMKFFFKRYLEFEKTEGTDETVEAVKAKAREYVQSKVGG